MRAMAAPRGAGSFRVAGTALALAITLGFLATPAGAIDLSGQEYRLNIDTTLSWGANYRLEDRDLDLIGLPEGGNAFSVNGDDGNLNFDTGISSNAIQAIVDVDFAYKNFGFFARGFGFYDFEIEDGDRARTPLSDDALDRVGSRAELRDAFVWFNFNLGRVPVEIRAGEQVINWGESTFIQGGINVINPVDVSALRVPGAELRTALLPIGAVWASIGLSDSLNLEAFYQYRWEEIIIDPPGTYFSTNDFAGRGGTHVWIGFGDFPDTGRPPGPLAILEAIRGPYTYPFMAAPRAEDREPDDGGQYGVSLKWLAEGLGNTEFGLYYMNYHSRLPVVNGIAGSVAGAQAGQADAGAVYAYFGVPPGASPQVDGLASAAATAAFVNSARYFISYPEDIKLYGLSWNSQLGTSGIAFQGEVSYRQDQPFLVDDVELLFAALSPISAGLAAVNQVVPGGAQFSEEIPGARFLDAWQGQFTMTKVFGPGLGADQSLLLVEAAVNNVPDLPDKDVLRMEAPGTYTSGNPLMSGPGGAHAGKPYEPASAFADSTSWGYRLAGRMDFNNAIGAWNLSPRFGWQHDVSGNSPGPGGNFVDGRTALTLGIGASYQNKWEIDLSWTTYDGAGRYNLINDRDFLAGIVKFSF